MKAILRFSLLSAIGLFYLVAILEHSEPLVMTVGLAPIVWLALEGAWHLTSISRPHQRKDRPWGF